MTGRLGAGFHSGVPASVYHADPAPEPSLSSSVAKVLVEQSPLHARHAHPRLNPDAREKNGDHLDIGQLAHSLILEGEAKVVVVEADTWAKKDARIQRSEARQAGLIPVLAHQWEKVRGIVHAFERQAGGMLHAPGQSEVTLLWPEVRCWCRARLDRLYDDATILDLKTTAGSAHPDAAARRLFQLGYDFQTEFYARGYERMTGRRPLRFVFGFIEVEPPHALSWLEVSPADLETARRKVEHAIKMWADCLGRNSWPGYAGAVWMAQAPKFLEDRWLAREGAGDDGPAMALALSRPLEGIHVTHVPARGEGADEPLGGPGWS